MKIFTNKYLINILFLLGWLSLVFGLFLPILNVKGRILGIIIKNDTTNILGAISNLWNGEKVFIAIIITIFSVIFPVAKMTAASLIWFKLVGRNILSHLSWLHHLGRWSMLDVFVVAVFIVVAQFHGNMNTRPMIGLYVFFSHVIISMVLTGIILGKK